MHPLSLSAAGAAALVILAACSPASRPADAARPASTTSAAPSASASIPPRTAPAVSATTTTPTASATPTAPEPTASEASTTPPTTVGPTTAPAPLRTTATPSASRTPRRPATCTDERGNRLRRTSGDVSCEEMRTVAKAYWAAAAAGRLQGQGGHADIGTWHCATAVLPGVPMATAPTECDEGSRQFFIGR